MNQVLQASLTVPPETPEYNPVFVTLLPLVPVLEEIALEFPPGCLGAVRVRLLEGGRPIAPLTGWYTGNAEAKRINISRKLEGPPYTLVVQGFSTAHDYPHTISVLVTARQ